MTASPPVLILASASPRRSELVSFFGVPFRVLATDAEEQAIPLPPLVAATLQSLPLAVAVHPALLAWRKAVSACAETPYGVIIGADTIVVLDGEVLGKPRDPGEARAMLRRLSGRTHTVYTGLAVIGKAAHCNGQDVEPDLQLDLVSADVSITELTDTQIADYVATGEPLDKAGAYGAQGLGGRLVRAVFGSYTCVVGLPLITVYRMLVAAGVRGLADPVEAYYRWLAANGKEPLPCPPTSP